MQSTERNQKRGPSSTQTLVRTNESSTYPDQQPSAIEYYLEKGHKYWKLLFDSNYQKKKNKLIFIR